ncbi:hypothetical protein CVT25_008677 [Psilocybe cyanescens]|uniref:Secreted protein n=1 Tax=Psilocybe cyanescens TaxID=93625 RepID=A0A409XL96_PSICY|nr:hypothetical protein CVT25_008677 [Psilocybe cyanescens]
MFNFIPIVIVIDIVVITRLPVPRTHISKTPRCTSTSRSTNTNTPQSLICTVLIWTVRERVVGRRVAPAGLQESSPVVFSAMSISMSM